MRVNKAIPYSKASLITDQLKIIVPALLLIWVSTDVVNIWMIAASALLVLLMVVVALKHLTGQVIPAYKGRPAIELTEHFLKNNVDNYTINWANIKQIHLGDDNTISVELTDGQLAKSGYLFSPLNWLSKGIISKTITINTQPVKGKAPAIHETLFRYWDS